MTSPTDPPRSVFVVWSAAKGPRCYIEKVAAEIDAEHYAPPAEVVEYVPLASLESERSAHDLTRGMVWVEKTREELARAVVAVERLKSESERLTSPPSQSAERSAPPRASTTEPPGKSE